ncbi:hypothetical protein F4818DRAFT_440789 [Hypoxylon cercidicola]|nr:hypothetical protein F4818DRAFT_440789 [Hypoxylon cercidicola]
MPNTNPQEPSGPSVDDKPLKSFDIEPCNNTDSILDIHNPTSVQPSLQYGSRPAEYHGPQYGDGGHHTPYSGMSSVSPMALNASKSGRAIHPQQGMSNSQTTFPQSQYFVANENIDHKHDEDTYSTIVPRDISSSVPHSSPSNMLERVPCSSFDTLSHNIPQKPTKPAFNYYYNTLDKVRNITRPYERPNKIARAVHRGHIKRGTGRYYSPSVIPYNNPQQLLSSASRSSSNTMPRVVHQQHTGPAVDGPIQQTAAYILSSSQELAPEQPPVLGFPPPNLLQPSFSQSQTLSRQPLPRVLPQPHPRPQTQQDFDQRGECKALVTLFRRHLRLDLRKKHEHALRDFADSGKWPTEVYRVDCPRPGYQIVLYATKITNDAVFDPQNDLFWEDLMTVASQGVNIGFRCVPRALPRLQPSVGVYFLRVHNQAPNSEMNLASTVSNDEYWFSPWSAYPGRRLP